MRYDGGVFLWDGEMKTINVHDYLVEKCGVAKVTHEYVYFENFYEESLDRSFNKIKIESFGKLASEIAPIEKIVRNGESRDTVEYSSKVVMMPYEDYMKLLDLVHGLELIDDRELIKTRL